MKTKLIIDTSTITSINNLPSFVEILPLIIIESENKEEKDFKDILEINVDQIKKLLNKKTYKTSQPNIGAMYDMLEKLYNENDRIIISVISNGISSTYDTLQGVIKEVDKENKILLLNSKQASYGGWKLNQKLIKLIEENKTNEEIIDAVSDFNNKHGLFFFLTDIDFLIKGGRVSNLKGFIAKKIKLIIGVFWRDGSLKSISKDKTIEKLFKKSLELELKYKNKKIEDIKEITFYYDKENDKELFEKNIENIKKENSSITFIEVDYKSPSAVFVHTGTGFLIFDVFFQ